MRKPHIAPSFKWPNYSKKSKKWGKNRSGHINLVLFEGKHSDATIFIAECNIVPGSHKDILQNICLNNNGIKLNFAAL